MATNKKELKLRTGEIYGMELMTGYPRYHAFGTDLREVFKCLVRMYNWNARSKYNTSTFVKLMKTEDYYCYVYKFDMTKTFGFDDDCQSLGRHDGIELGSFAEMYNRKEI